MKWKMGLLLLLLTSTCLYAGQSPEPIRHSTGLLPEGYANPMPEESGHAAQPSGLPTSWESQEAAFTSDAPPEASAARNGHSTAASKLDAQGHKKPSRFFGLAALLGMPLAWRWLRRAKTDRSQGPRNQRQRKQMAAGLAIVIAILVGLVLFGVGLLAAAGLLQIAWSMFWRMTLGILCSLGSIALTIGIVAAILESADVDLKLDRDDNIGLILLTILVGIPVVLGLGALVFWLFLNLFLPVTIGFFVAGGVMAITVTALLTAIRMMSKIVE